MTRTRKFTGLITLVLFIIFFIFVLPKVFADDDIFSGVIDVYGGNANFRITSDGDLIIGAEGETQYLANFDIDELGTHVADNGASYHVPNSIYVKRIRFIGNVVMLNSNRNHPGMQQMFSYGYPILQSINFTNLDTSQVTDMSRMLANNTELTTIIWGNIDTSNVENMSQMFYGCDSLTNLSLTKFNTSKVKNMDSMFKDCSSLRTVNISSFDTTGINSYSGLNYMFSGCPLLEKIDISNFRNPTNYELDAYGIFQYDENLSDITIGQDLIGIWSLPEPPNSRPYTGKWISYDEKLGPYYSDDFAYNLDVTEEFATRWVWEGTKLNWKGSKKPPVFLTQKGTQVDVTLSDRVYLNGLPETTTAEVTPATVTNNLSSGGIKVTNILADGTNNNGYILDEYTKDFTTYPADSHRYAIAYQSNDLKEGFEISDIIPASGNKEYNFLGKTTLSTETVTEDDNKDIGSLIFTIGLDNYVYPYFRPDPSSILGQAYAVLDDDNNLIFFRSNTEYNAGPHQTATDIKGNEYSGILYTDFEDTGDRPWGNVSDAIKQTWVAEGQTISPVNMNNWFWLDNATLIDLSGFDLTKIEEIGSLGSRSYEPCTINMSNKHMPNLGFDAEDSDVYNNYIYVYNGTINFENCKIENIDDLSRFTFRVGGEGTINLQNSNFDCVKYVNEAYMPIEGSNETTINMQNTSWANYVNDYDVYGHDGRIALVSPGMTHGGVINAQNAKFPKATTGIFWAGNFNFGDCQGVINLNNAELDSLESTSYFLGETDNVILNLDGTKLPSLKYIDGMNGNVGAHTTANLSNLDLSGVEEVSSTFISGTRSSLNMYNVDLSGVTDADNLVSGVYGGSVTLQNVDLSGTTANFNIYGEEYNGVGTNILVDNVVFSDECTSIPLSVGNSGGTTIIRNLSFPNVTEAPNFVGDSAKSTTLSNIELPSLTDASYMFGKLYGWYDYDYVPTITFDNIILGQIKNMDYMFKDCAYADLDLSFITDTSHVTSMEGMFEGCRQLSEIDLSHFTTPLVTNMKNMFKDCEAISTIDIRGFSTSQVTDMTDMFNNCPNLTNIYVGNGWSTEGLDNVAYDMFSNDEKLPHYDSDDVTSNKAYHENDPVRTDGLGYLKYAS